MILGTGIDIVHVKRLETWGEKICARWFHPAEYEAACSRGTGKALSLAARFAAKEAFGKALGTGLSGMNLRDIEVANSDSGKPVMVLHGTAREALSRVVAGEPFALNNGREADGLRVHLSLTHDEGNAVAMVIIEKCEV